MLHQLNLSRIPITFFIGLTMIGAPLALLILFFIYQCIITLATVITQAFVAFPIFFGMVFIVLIQIAPLGVAGFFMLKAAYRWSKAGIVITALAAPLGFIVGLASVANHFDSRLDASSGWGVALILFLGIVPLITLTIAYYDIRYRRNRFIAPPQSSMRAE